MVMANSAAKKPYEPTPVSKPKLSYAYTTSERPANDTRRPKPKLATKDGVVVTRVQPENNRRMLGDTASERTLDFETGYRGRPELVGEKVLKSAKDTRRARIQGEDVEPEYVEGAEYPQNFGADEPSLRVKLPAQEEKSDALSLLAMRRRARAIGTSLPIAAGALTLWPVQLTFFFVSLAGLGLLVGSEAITSIASTIAGWLPIPDGWNPLRWLVENAANISRSVSLSIFFVGYTITLMIGLWGIMCAYMAYTIRFVDCTGGLKGLMLMVAIVLTLAPFLNFLPWVLLWIVAVILDQGKDERVRS